MLKLKYGSLILILLYTITDLIGYVVYRHSPDFTPIVLMFLVYMIVQDSDKPKEISNAELGDFVDWITDHEYVKYPKGWTLRGGANGWHCTTQELLHKFRNRHNS